MFLPGAILRVSLTHPSVGPDSGRRSLVQFNNPPFTGRPPLPLHSNLARSSRTFPCSICNELVELETAKVDETGKPVHEECYVQKVILEKSVRPPPGASNAEDNGNPLSQAVVAFLDSATAQSITDSCPECGSQLEHRKLTFFYAGRSWEIQVAICLDCIDTDPPAPYDA
jgi:hypothetical protein